jgi:archaellum biogenesis ATPase FlaH
VHESEHNEFISGGAYRSISDIPSIFKLSKTAIPFAVPGMIAFGAITMISGDSGAGKSTLVTWLAHCLSRGDPFLGINIERPIRCLYLDRENGVHVVRDRFERLGITEEQLDHKRFKYWIATNGDEPEFDDHRILDWTAEYPDSPVILIDSQIAFYEGEENSSSHSRRFWRRLRKLAIMGAAVVILHHTGKAESAKDFRGSSDFKAAIDVGYILVNLRIGQDLSDLRLRAFKRRFSVEAEFFLGSSCSGEGFIRKADPSTYRATVLELVRNAPGISKGELETAGMETDIPRASVRTLLNELERCGSIRSERGPNNALKFYPLL